MEASALVWRIVGAGRMAMVGQRFFMVIVGFDCDQIDLGETNAAFSF